MYTGVTYASITATITNGGVTRNITVTGTNVGANAQDPSAAVVHTYTLDEPLVIAVDDACVVNWTSTSNEIINYTEINGVDTTPLALNASGSELPYAFSVSGNDLLLTWNNAESVNVTESDYNLVRHALHTFDVTGLLTSAYNGYPWSLNGGEFYNVKTAAEITGITNKDNSIYRVFSPDDNTVQVVFNAGATVVDNVLQRGAQNTKLEIDLGAEGPSTTANQTVYKFSDGTTTLTTSRDAKDAADLASLLGAQNGLNVSSFSKITDAEKISVEFDNVDRTGTGYTLTREAQRSVQTFPNIDFTDSSLLRGRKIAFKPKRDQQINIGTPTNLSMEPTIGELVGLLNASSSDRERRGWRFAQHGFYYNIPPRILRRRQYSASHLR